MFKNWFKKSEEPKVNTENDQDQEDGALEIEFLSDEEETFEETIEVVLEDTSDDDLESNAPQAPGFFKRLFTGLEKTRKGITDKIDNLINQYDVIDDALLDEIEEVLITADIGMQTTLKLMESLKAALIERKIMDASLIKGVLSEVMESYLSSLDDSQIHTPSPTVILVIGVNGAGKTTTIGKLAHQLQIKGQTVLVAAADTFRAAAIDQLKIWGQRAGVDVIAQSEGSDPAAVVFDAIQAAKSRKTDVLICDTAGRLHNKKNLMNELSKMTKIIDREYPEAHKEVLLVLDGTTGQNAIQQAKLFQEVTDVSGIVLTKLDGTAKGGVVLAIYQELKIPVKLIGVGEGIKDLQRFHPHEFVAALLDQEV
jgi:fused signal recognition particle receptor